jgi:hypothetical protein
MKVSRAIMVLGMHRSGTSVVTRGLQALGVNIGTDFIESQSDNPTGYWENPKIVALNERVLAAFGLSWFSTGRIADADWQGPAIAALRTEAADMLAATYFHYPLWGFKDPRTLRLLPFWQNMPASFEQLYILVIRNPLSIAGSLFSRQAMPAATAHLLWIAYLCPYLQNIVGHRFVVVDYDLFMGDAARQLRRVAHLLELPAGVAQLQAVDHFTNHFVDAKRRHHVFEDADFDAIPHLGVLTRAAYWHLRHLAASDETAVPDAFWAGWAHISTKAMARLPAHPRLLTHH